MPVRRRGVPGDASAATHQPGAGPGLQLQHVPESKRIDQRRMGRLSSRVNPLPEARYLKVPRRLGGRREALLRRLRCIGIHGLWGSGHYLAQYRAAGG